MPPDTLVDSHCHIPVIAQESGDDTGNIIRRARTAGVSHMLCVCIDLETFPEVLDLTSRFTEVFGSVGVHPNTDEKAREPTVDDLCRLAEHESIIAIGETGLDYFRSRGELEWQRQRFRNQIRAARTVNRPLIVHTRDAAADVIRLLKAEQAADVGGVMHCFVDDWATAQAAMALNFYISFTGIISFRSAGPVRDVARRIPLDRLLVETDSPWLAPAPHRGKRNEPAFVRYVAEHLAYLRGIEFTELASATSNNFLDLFPLARPDR